MKDEKTALVRQCDRCGMTTACDIDGTQQHAKEMEMEGQTVRWVTEQECKTLEGEGGKCKCSKGIDGLDELVINVRREQDKLFPDQRLELWKSIQNGYCPECGFKMLGTCYCKVNE